MKILKVRFKFPLLVSAMVISVLFVACNSATKTSQSGDKNKEISSIPISSNVKKGVLSNGITYYIQRNAKPEQKVELRLVVNAGSILEDKKQLGLAHFMEHMNFNGSKNFNKNELVDYLQSIGVKFGAHLNAYTSFDETVYILPIPSDDDEKLEKGFLILEDWAFNASLTEEEIDKERGVVLEEYRLGLGAEKKMLSRYLPKLMYNSRYAERLPIGTKEVLENFTYEDLRRFYKDWYRPDLMAVVAVGDIDVAVLEEKIKAHFGKYKTEKKPKKRKIYNVPNHKKTFVAIEKDTEASRSVVQVYYKDPVLAKKVTTEEHYKEKLVNSLFSTMINNRLDELRNKEEPPYVFGGSRYGGSWSRNNKVYQSYALSSELGQFDSLMALVQENERALRFGFQEGELERAKISMTNRYERAFKERNKNESSSYAGEYVRNYLEGEIIPGIAWEFDRVQKYVPMIAIEDCNALLPKYLHEDNRVIVFTGPDKEEVPVITEAQVLALLSEVKNMELTAYKDAVMDVELMRGLKLKKGVLLSEATDSINDVKRFELSNGATIIYKKTNFKDNQIVFSAFSYGGTSLYTDEEYLKTDMANSALTEAGINGFTKTELKKLMTGKGASVTPTINTLSEGMHGSATPKDFECLFQLLHLYFTKLNNDPKAYNSHVAKMKAYLKNALSEPRTYFGIETGAFLNSENPRYVGFPTDAMWSNTDYNLAVDKYRERFADASDFNFYFVGNLDPEVLKKYAALYIGSLPSTKTDEKFIDNGYRPLYGALEKHVKKGTEPKSLVKIQFRGEAIYNAEEDYYLQSLGEVLSIKLIEKLREEEGGVYGVGARGGMSRSPYGSYSLTISFPCGPEKMELLQTKALEELQKIIDNGPEAKDIAKIKETQLLEHKEQLKENRFWMNRIKNADFNQIPLKNISEQVDKIHKLTAKNIQEIAKKYAVKNKFVATLNPETPIK
jgi:zinc protease